MTHTFRASYSVLSVWKNGDWERAIKMYFKLEQFTTRAMAEGRDYHDAWEKYINETKTLPLELTGGVENKLINPQCEIKLLIPIYDWLNLVLKIDCLDAPTIHEFKTGKQSSEVYASDWQTGVYGFGCTMPGFQLIGKKQVPWKGVYVDRIKLWHFDQYTKQSELSKVWITDKLLDDARNWVITVAGEMHNYFITNSLYERFGPHLASINGTTNK